MMLSRIFWIGIAGIALVTGMVLQDGGRIIRWAGDSGIADGTARRIEAQVDRAINRGIDRMEVTDAAGREINVSKDARHALAAAISELVHAETDLALAKARDADSGEIKAATERRDQARLAVDRLKAQIKGEDWASASDSDAVQQQVEHQVRDDVRETIWDAVRN